jgi:hypothetical protein
VNKIMGIILTLLITAAVKAEISNTNMVSNHDFKKGLNKWKSSKGVSIEKPDDNDTRCVKLELKEKDSYQYITQVIRKIKSEGKYFFEFQAESPGGFHYLIQLNWYKRSGNKFSKIKSDIPWYGIARLPEFTTITKMLKAPVGANFLEVRFQIDWSMVKSHPGENILRIRKIILVSCKK